MTTVVSEPTTAPVSSDLHIGSNSSVAGGRLDSYDELPATFQQDLISAEMTREINANPEETEQLRRVRQHIGEEEAGRWLGEGENVSDAID